jgi:hypothetical protein
MSAAALFALDGARGWGKVRFGLPERDAPPDEPMWNYSELRERVGVPRHSLLLDVILSAQGKRRFVRIDVQKTAASFRRTMSYIRSLLRDLVEYGYLARSMTEASAFMPLYENFQTADRIGDTITHPGYRRRKPGEENEDDDEQARLEQGGEEGGEEVGCRDEPVAQGTGELEAGSVDGCAAYSDAPGSGSPGGSQVHIRADSQIRGFSGRGAGTVEEHERDVADVGDDGSVLPDERVEGNRDVQRICPTCNGTGRVSVGSIDAPATRKPASVASSGTGSLVSPAQVDLRVLESHFAQTTPKSLNLNIAAAAKMLDITREEQAKEQTVLAFAAELEKLNAWVIRQPWAHASNDRRRMLDDAEARPVIEAIHAEGYTAEQYVNWQLAAGVTLSRDRENVTGLLISLIPRRRRAYSAADRANDRSTDPPGKRRS